MSWHQVRVEKVFRTPEEVQRGLMYDYAPLTPGGVALFVFSPARPVSMWMQNTYVALDMIFLDAARRVICVRKHQRPFSQERAGCGQAVAYVLEAHSGYADLRGIRVGDGVRWAPQAEASQT